MTNRRFLEAGIQTSESQEWKHSGMDAKHANL